MATRRQIVGGAAALLASAVAGGGVVYHNLTSGRDTASPEISRGGERMDLGDLEEPRPEDAVKFQASVARNGQKPITYEIGDETDTRLSRFQTTRLLEQKVRQAERELQPYGPQAPRVFRLIDADGNYVLSPGEVTGFDIDHYVRMVKEEKGQGDPVLAGRTRASGRRIPLYLWLRR